ncbi:MAG: ABC transporter ATP-binding protein [Ignavibacteriales bacterium]|nr:ABC transporter ATP-binding protein [Ignavibacteriales bacterium]
MADRITLTSFSLRYSEAAAEVLSSISLDVTGGTCCAILGPTGAGKSSLQQCLAGTMRRHHPECVSSGSIQIGDSSFAGLPSNILFPTVGLVLQDPHVQISGVRDTVLDEVLFTLENTGQVPDDPEAELLPLLRNLGIDHLATRKPTSLSGGETQRVALATILVAKPRVLLLDEPTTALDLAAQDKLRGILKSMKVTTTIVLADTQLDFALGICDQIVVLDRGRIVFDGTPGAFMGRLEEFQDAIPLENWIPLKQKILKLTDDRSRNGARIAETLGLL